MKEKLPRLSQFASGLVLLAVVLSLAAFSVETDSVVDVKVIYGPDDRQDVYEVTNPDLLSISQATAIILEDYEITDNGDDTYDLNTVPYADYRISAKQSRLLTNRRLAFVPGSLWLRT